MGGLEEGKVVTRTKTDFNMLTLRKNISPVVEIQRNGRHIFGNRIIFTIETIKKLQQHRKSKG